MSVALIRRRIGPVGTQYPYMVVLKTVNIHQCAIDIGQIVPVAGVVGRLRITAVDYERPFFADNGIGRGAEFCPRRHPVFSQIIFPVGTGFHGCEQMKIVRRRCGFFDADITVSGNENIPASVFPSRLRNIVDEYHPTVGRRSYRCSVPIGNSFARTGNSLFDENGFILECRSENLAFHQFKRFTGRINLSAGSC